MISLTCAICGKKSETTELYPATFDFEKINARTFSARRTPDRVHYRLVKCKRCGLIFSNPILEQNRISSLYSRSSFHYPEESGYLKKLYTSYLKKILPRRSLGSVRLLDIGCGNGFFLEQAKNLGINDIWGVEPGKASVSKAPVWLKNRIKISMFKTGLFQKRFDVITCFHTLDHVVDPNEFLRTTRGLLKDGGRNVFVVHDTDGLSQKLFGEKSPIFDIEHIYLFNKISLKRLFRKNGFKDIRIFDVENIYPVAYWVRMTPIPRKLKVVLLSLLMRTGLGKIPLRLKAGNIGIVATRK